jgi:hypothetical protein
MYSRELLPLRVNEAPAKLNRDVAVAITLVQTLPRYSAAIDKNV